MSRLFNLLSIVLLISTISLCQSPPAAGNHGTVIPDITELTTRAQGGDAEAQFALGRAYEKGQGVRQSDDTAVLWYRKSAEQGFADGETALAIMYRLGRGVEQDKAEAVRWYEKAAKQGNPAALFNLAVAYYNGDGVGANTWTAYKYFLIAQKAGSKPAEDGVSRIGAEMKPAEIADARFEIAGMYEDGIVVKQSYSEAVAWYEQSAGMGNPKAQLRLARLYDNGIGVPQDFRKGLALCEAAANKNFSPGHVCAGFHYQHGWGVTQDGVVAANWYNEAMKLGNGLAFYLLGHMYWDGAGVPMDKRRGYEYLLLLAAAGDKQAKSEVESLKTQLSNKDAQHATDRAREWVKAHGNMELVHLLRTR